MKIENPQLKCHFSFVFFFHKFRTVKKCIQIDFSILQKTKILTIQFIFFSRIEVTHVDIFRIGYFI